MSLRLRLIQAITCVLLGTLVLGGIMLYWHAVRKINTEMTAAIAVGGRIVRNAVDDVEELIHPRRRLELIVGDFDGDRHFQATLLGAHGDVIVQSKWLEPEHPAPEWLHRLLATTPRVIVLKLPAQFAQYGRIILKTDARNEVAEVWADAKLYLMLLTLLCVAILSVLYVTLGHALQPLQQLINGFNEIGRGDRPQRIRASGPTEVALLADGFNDMADRLVAMKDRNARLREQLEAVQEEERAELARNLHDEVSPLLFSVDVDAISVARLAEKELGSPASERVKSHADAIKSAVSLLKRNVKSILSQLRPAGLHALSLKSTIEDLTSFWKARDANLKFTLDVPEKSWGVKIDSAIQSIVRESLSNAMKHSKPRHIEVSIFENEADDIIVEITDDGGGLSKPPGGDGLGIIGMRERAILLGGTLTVEERATPKGVVVTLCLPAPVAYASGTPQKADKQLEQEGTA